MKIFDNADYQEKEFDPIWIHFMNVLFLHEMDRIICILKDYWPNGLSQSLITFVGFVFDNWNPNFDYKQLFNNLTVKGKTR